MHLEVGAEAGVGVGEAYPTLSMCHSQGQDSEKERKWRKMEGMEEREKNGGGYSKPGQVLAEQRERD